MISILLATYNGERYISKAIDSVLFQTYKNFELLVGFNGTNDNSKFLVRKLQDTRVKIFDYGDDKGKAKTLNKLLKESQYNIICLQDDDDVWMPNKLESQLGYINNFDIVGTMIRYIDELDNKHGRPNLSSDHDEIVFLSQNGINQVANTSAMFKKSDAEEIGGWNETLDGIEDYDFWLKMMRAGKKFKNLNEELVLHRVHSRSNFNTKTYDTGSIL